MLLLFPTCDGAYRTRRYLPPPVLDVLDNKQIEGAKRAAMLTTALKYALDRVPLAMVPPQARPAMRLLKAFTPYLGYVGGFVAWSWGAVKSFDKGMLPYYDPEKNSVADRLLRQWRHADSYLAFDGRCHTRLMGGH
jgi:hypothetical protein